MKLLNIYYLLVFCSQLNQIFFIIVTSLKQIAYALINLYKLLHSKYFYHIIFLWICTLHLRIIINNWNLLIKQEFTGYLHTSSLSILELADFTACGWCGTGGCWVYYNIFITTACTTNQQSLDQVMLIKQIVSKCEVAKIIYFVNINSGN